jgi:hypothetical protein
MCRRFACLFPGIVRRVGRRASRVDRGVDFLRENSNVLSQAMCKVLRKDSHQNWAEPYLMSTGIASLDSWSCGRKRELRVKQEHDDLRLSRTKSGVKEVRAHGISTI